MVQQSISALGALMVLAPLGHAGAQPPITFTRIVGTGTPSPDGGIFTSAGAASIDNGMIAFRGFTNRSNDGIFMWTSPGVIHTVADRNTPAPGGPGDFTGFASSTPTAAGYVAFEAASFTVGGVYSNVGGALRAVADTNTAIPGGQGQFGLVNLPAFNGTEAAFVGVGTGQEGVYRWSQPTGLTVVANRSTPIPGGIGTFDGFQGDFPSFDASAVAFSPSARPDGIYTWMSGTLAVVADSHTYIPGGTGMFTDLGAPSYDGGAIAFFGVGSAGQQGLYLAGAGGASRIADTTTPIPGGHGTFTAFGMHTLDGGRMIFDAIGPDAQSGIYLYQTGALAKVLAPNDSLDGRVVASVQINPDSALSGLAMVLGVGFTDGTGAIYLATVPEPPALLLVLMATPLLTPRIGHRRKGVPT